MTADGERICREVAQLWEKVGRARSRSDPSSSQTSTTPSSVALLCKACCSPPDHGSPPSFICSSILHIHQLPTNVLRPSASSHAGDARQSLVRSLSSSGCPLLTTKCTVKPKQASTASPAPYIHTHRHARILR